MLTIGAYPLLCSLEAWVSAEAGKGSPSAF